MPSGRSTVGGARRLGLVQPAGVIEARHEHSESKKQVRFQFFFFFESGPKEGKRAGEPLWKKRRNAGTQPQHPPLPDRQQFRACFSLSRPILALFFSLSGGLLVEFWWCFKRRDPQRCTIGLSGCRQLAGPPPIKLPLSWFGLPRLWAPAPLGP